MSKEVRLGSHRKQSKPIFEEALIRNPSPRILCPMCEKEFGTRQGWLRHYDGHTLKCELVKYIENPKADLHLQRYGYKLPEKE